MLLLVMYEAKQPCELKAFNATGHEVPTEIVETTVTKTQEGQDMTLTAYIGTGIKKVSRKTYSSINYIAVIAKKAEVQTWSDVEGHLWEEYYRSWNTVKYNAEGIYNAEGVREVHHPGAGDKVKNRQV